VQDLLPSSGGHENEIRESLVACLDGRDEPLDVALQCLSHCSGDNLARVEIRHDDWQILVAGDVVLPQDIISISRKHVQEDEGSGDRRRAKIENSEVDILANLSASLFL